MHEIAGAIIAITFDGSGIYSCSFHVGTSGVFYRQFSITMATAIILSGIVALTLTPSLCYDVKNNHGALKENTY
jgi:HAE1 family hydrophobic/amphiphilic exporter-1